HPFVERQAIVESFATLLEENRVELSEAIYRETGKPRWESLSEVQAMVNKVAISLRSWHARCSDRADGESLLRHRPHGVMAVFGHYNFPGHLP
ncbi:aldehyde dehydrogenase family protein, partial [Erwinia amylovora]|uniref:aldehyde dehydrogenase family protein n=1 Tax=Erwinia amylovora TaxID=552 RepID=UPI0020BFA845